MAAHLRHPLPDQVTDAAGALLEPLGVALHALDLGHVGFGATVAVIGCGPIGLLLIQLLRAAGAREFGAHEVLEPASDLSSYGADVAFEIAGSDPAVRAAMETVRPGGRVVLGGIPDDDSTTFPASLVRRKGLTIAMVRRMNEVYGRAIDLAGRGAVSLEPLISRRAGLADAADAFGAAQRRSGLKVIVTP